MNTIKKTFSLILLLSLAAIPANFATHRITSNISNTAKQTTKYLDKKAVEGLIIDALEGKADALQALKAVNTKEIEKDTGINQDFLDEVIAIISKTPDTSNINSIKRYFRSLPTETVNKLKGAIAGVGAATLPYGIGSALYYLYLSNPSGAVISGTLTGGIGYGLHELYKAIKPWEQWQVDFVSTLQKPEQRQKDQAHVTEKSGPYKYINKKAIPQLVGDAFDGTIKATTTLELLDTQQIAHDSGIDKALLDDLIELAKERMVEKSRIQRFINSLPADTIDKLKGFILGTSGTVIPYGILNTLCYAYNLDATAFLAASALTAATGYGLKRAYQSLKPAKSWKDLGASLALNLLSKAQASQVDTEETQNQAQAQEQEPLIPDQSQDSEELLNQFCLMLSPEQKKLLPNEQVLALAAHKPALLQREKRFMRSLTDEQVLLLHDILSLSPKQS